jgi:aquaporin NIP
VPRTFLLLKNTLFMKRLFTEFLGTFVLIFVGTGAIVIDSSSGGSIGHCGISMVFGLAVLAMIHTFGDVSGAHLNPAVSIGFAAAGRFPWKDVPGYATAQLAGALAASFTVQMLFPHTTTLGTTLPAGSEIQSLVLEIILTAILMLVILNVSTGAKEKGITAGITIGAVITLEAILGGPISGASMNPARSLAPAIVSGNFQHLWLYPVATILGALIAVPLCMATRETGCCGGKCKSLNL